MIPKRKWPWVAQQNWKDILFIHTPVPYTTIRTYVPRPIEIDTYMGTCWVSIVLFQAKQSRLRMMPEFLSYPCFRQMNIRTYVRFGNERGVYFFSINVDDRFVQFGGRMACMPYSRADMTIKRDRDTIHFTASDIFGYPKGVVNVTYSPATPVFTASDDSLAFFLTERYCIWMCRSNRIVKAPILHSPWALQKEEVTINANEWLPLPITSETIAHYAIITHAILSSLENIA